MTLQASGAISLLDIAGEFSGAAPHALSEYYRSPNGLTSDNNTGVPLSGAIDFADFYSTTFVARGEQVYGAGTHTWTVPTGVTSVSVYALSGGSAGRTSGSGSGGSGGSYAYLNSHAVTPGEDIEVVVGAGGLAPSGGGGVSTFRNATTLRAAYFSTVGTSNGNGGTGGTATSSGSSDMGGGGGGAAGYSGNNTGAGGNGNTNGSNGSGGGGGGGGGGLYVAGDTRGGWGGGVGIYGLGANGAGGLKGDAGATGGAGSGGSGNVYGGGGGGRAVSGATNGVAGVVRIIWGPGRSFPSTDVGAS